MKRLQSRQRVRFTPKVELLEDRSLLSAVSRGGGVIVTTGAFNTVAITDDGQFVRVFANNNPRVPSQLNSLAAFTEGTPITVRTTKGSGSTNSVFLYLQGSNGTGDLNPTSLLTTLNVNFGFGPGTLTVDVEPSVAGPPFNPGPYPYTPLGADSNVQITTTSTAPPPGRSAGGVMETLNCGGLGAHATLSMDDTSGRDGGTGPIEVTAIIIGSQQPSSELNLIFEDNRQSLLAGIFLNQDDIQGGAATYIALAGGPSSNEQVYYTGQLQGLLFVSEAGGFEQVPVFGLGGNDDLVMDYTLYPGSTGSLISQQDGGFNDTRLTQEIFKSPGDDPRVQAGTDGGHGMDTEAFLTQGNPATTNVFVVPTDLRTVIPVY